MRGDFFDTNVILYLLDDGRKADTAETLLATGGAISVQVLNETLVNCRRKAGMSWQETGDFLTGIRSLCRVVDLTPELHETGLALGARYGFSVYDAMIVAAALHGGCETLYSEDMQHGMRVEERLRIVDPFRPA
ncbi:MAG: PIN domain-containing protein [Jhaorihella sp.]